MILEPMGRVGCHGSTKHEKHDPAAIVLGHSASIVIGRPNHTLAACEQSDGATNCG